MTEPKEPQILWVENDLEEIAYRENDSDITKLATWAHKEPVNNSTKYIEHSAYQALQSELEKVKTELDRIKSTWSQEEIDLAKAKAEQLRLNLFGDEVVKEEIVKLESELENVKVESKKLLKAWSSMSDRYIKKCEELGAEKAKSEQLISALQYYASEEAYRSEECDKLNGEGGFFPYDCNDYHICTDDKWGNKARAAILEYKGEK